MLHRFLAVLRGVADVIAGRALDRGKPLAKPRDDFLRVVKAQGRLREEGKLARIFDFEGIHGGDGVHHQSAVGSFAGSANDFLVVFVADQDNGAPFAREF